MPLRKPLFGGRYRIGGKRFKILGEAARHAEYISRNPEHVPDVIEFAAKHLDTLPGDALLSDETHSAPDVAYKGPLINALSNAYRVAPQHRVRIVEIAGRSFEKVTEDFTQMELAELIEKGIRDPDPQVSQASVRIARRKINEDFVRDKGGRVHLRRVLREAGYK